MMYQLAALVIVGSAASAAVPLEEIERGEFWWTFPDTDCMAGDEIGQCGTFGNATVQECKAACYANPNCGGFNIPNGHMKKLGCADEMIPWGDDPSHKAPVDPGHHALTLYTLSLYPPRREYWWELRGYDCNPTHELGNCKKAGLSAQGQRDHCKQVCEENIFCEGFNLPNGHLKAAGCKDDIIYEPKWDNGTMTLYYRRGHPQTRDVKRTSLRKIQVNADCNPGQEIGNCSQYLPPPYTESECASACKANPLCGGFNLPNGHLKTVDCIQDINETHTNQQLYYFTYETPDSRCLNALADLCGDEPKGERCTECIRSDPGLEKICTLEDLSKFCQ
eukprot:m.256974 g.256974  ORF g.256974 m.256974 type:complete len:335 (-) comp34893_c0_seq1:339-1343(-)